ncbi:MAG: prepilin-type N-terminal cleavage/methylation domain-containing protein [Pseudomonadota bacterium]
MGTPHRTDGFTLLEVMLASVLIAFMLIASYQLFAKTLLHQAHNTHIQRAIAIGSSLLETVRAFDCLAPNLQATCDGGDEQACRRIQQLSTIVATHRSQTTTLLPSGRLQTTRGGDGRLRITLTWDTGAPLTPGVFRLEILP